MNFKCYSSEELITLNTLHEVVKPGTHFTAESTEAMRIKSLAQGESILMLGIEPSTFVSKVDILTTTPIVHNNNKQQMEHVPSTHCILMTCSLNKDFVSKPFLTKSFIGIGMK